MAEDYASVIRELESLRENVRTLDVRVQELTGQEETLRQTLITAQALSDDLKRTAILVSSPHLVC